MGLGDVHHVDADGNNHSSGSPAKPHVQGGDVEAPPPGSLPFHHASQQTPVAGAPQGNAAELAPAAPRGTLFFVRMGLCIGMFVFSLVTFSCLAAAHTASYNLALSVAGLAFELAMAVVVFLYATTMIVFYILALATKMKFPFLLREGSVKILITDFVLLVLQSMASGSGAACLGFIVLMGGSVDSIWEVYYRGGVNKAQSIAYAVQLAQAGSAFSFFSSFCLIATFWINFTQIYRSRLT